MPHHSRSGMAVQCCLNVFALVVMAQLRAKTERDVDVLAQWKFRLVRLLYERGHGREVILELFRVMDWMIRLPESLEEAFRQEVYAFEEAKRMPYITSVERAGIEKGRAEGMQQGMQQGEATLLLRQIGRKFGASAVQDYRARVESADAETLLTWSERILVAARVEDVFVSR